MDTAAAGLDAAPGNCKAKTAAAGAAATSGLRTIKRIKQTRKCFHWDTGSPVEHAEDGTTVLLFGSDLDVFGVAYGVA